MIFEIVGPFVFPSVLTSFSGMTEMNTVNYIALLLWAIHTFYVLWAMSQISNTFNNKF